MSRKVILVDFYWTRDKDPRVPLGHASILTNLRAAGVAVKSLVFAVNDEDAEIDEATSEVLAAAAILGPHTDIAIGVYVWGENKVQRLTAALRTREFEGRIILGGPQISYAIPGVADVYPNADIFIRGYGEDALLEILLCPDSISNPGIVRKGDPDPGLPADVDLELLKSPFLTGHIKTQDQKFIRWETQRGCSFRCSFCQHREAGRRLTRRTLCWERIIAEIDLFCSTGVEDIAVLDPIFNLGPRAVPILRRFAENKFQGRISLQCRAEAITDDFVAAASKLDARLEFGLQTTNLAEGKAVNRGNHLDAVDQALSKVRCAGLDHEVSLIYGLPLQTLESFKTSVEWCIDRQVPTIKAFPLLLLRGTQLERDRDEWGLIDSGGPMSAVTGSTSFGFEDWLQMASISEALIQTETKHPRMSQLLDLAADLKPDFLRWMPAELWSAA